jgi:hypothetical protein
MRWLYAAAFCGLMVAPATAQELPISVRKMPIGDGGTMWDVILTNRSDALDIRHIELNRGACHATMDGSYPHPMRFGQQIRMRMFDCDPIEIHVEADQGSSTIEMPE